ncbi:hypothetical protein [Mycobacterium sp. PSTR-4-N]|uniref:hypothetical protein n=1 Tax=Mycobacterium sp. PSTR-4-N TaxID=2917745 RepID=UPI001F15687F|nr:hypothetical protein [Mycobacterium sp. PSTR-4-N]MCG7593728.1 hypothetical protein [Mycobacterium sp. PSTR-4-N]
MALIGWFLAALFVAEFWWAILAIAIVTLTVVLVRRAKRRRDAAAAALIRRADQQQAWALAGDPRGTYGIWPPVEPPVTAVRPTECVDS